MLVIRGAYIRGGLYSGGAYIRDFTVYLFIDIVRPVETIGPLKVLTLLRVKRVKSAEIQLCPPETKVI